MIDEITRYFLITNSNIEDKLFENTLLKANKICFIQKNYNGRRNNSRNYDIYNGLKELMVSSLKMIFFGM